MYYITINWCVNISFNWLVWKSAVLLGYSGTDSETRMELVGFVNNNLLVARGSVVG